MMMFVEKTHDDGMHDEVGPCLRASFQALLKGVSSLLWLASKQRFWKGLQTMKCAHSIDFSRA